ncbi:MAG TPA: hypothetical protein VOA80_03110 [Thermoanaerobaculia bacterium]|nr:hypothetical protein [Thermoanaerobaculia bacterium]
MSLDRGTSRQPAAAGDEKRGEKGEDGEEGEGGAVARRLRVLGAVCASLLVAVLATAAAIGWSAARPGAGDLMESPPFDSFLVALCAMLLVLLASAAYGRILRRQAPDELEESVEAEGEAEAEGAAAADDALAAEAAAEAEEPEARERAVAARLRAYSWATGASFGMLAVGAALGALVASAGKAPLYGLVICIAALFSMAARWPRRSGFDLALRPDREDAVSRAAAWRHLAQPFASHGAGASSSPETALGAGGREAAGEGAGSGATDAAAGAEPGGTARGDMGRRPG